MAVPAARRATRLLVYTDDAFGLGNLRRTLKICDQFAKGMPDLTILRRTFAELSSMREGVFHAAFRGFRPGIVLVDNVPTGIEGSVR